MAWLWQESSLEWSLVATLHGAFGPEEFQLVLRARRAVLMAGPGSDSKLTETSRLIHGVD